MVAAVDDVRLKHAQDIHAKGYPLILRVLVFLVEEIGGELVEVEWEEFVGAEIDVYSQQVEVDLVLLCDLPADEALEIAEFLFFFGVIVPYLAN